MLAKLLSSTQLASDGEHPQPPALFLIINSDNALQVLESVIAFRAARDQV